MFLVKNWPLFVFTLIIFLCGCASKHHLVPENENTSAAIEYCGGTLWGYVVPIGPRQDKSWWKKDLSDPKPLLAVFLHIHSANEVDPKNALTFNFAIRTREDVVLQIPDHTLKVQIDNSSERKLPMNFFLRERALAAHQLYRGGEYDLQLIDPATNKWRITRNNKFFYLIKEDVSEVILPVDKVQTLTAAAVSTKLDKKSYDEIYVLSALNIWPTGENLKNATITVTTPRLSLNGTTYEPRTFTYNMNYEKVKEVVGDRPYVRCPSTDMIFHWND